MPKREERKSGLIFLFLYPWASFIEPTLWAHGYKKKDKDKSGNIGPEVYHLRANESLKRLARR